MKRNRIAGLIVWTAAVSSAAWGQQPGAAIEGDRWEIGFEQRTRTEDWNNIIDYGNKTDDEREQIRYRTRAWMQAPVLPSITMYVGLVQETNQILGPAVTKFDETVFDQAYLDFHPRSLKGWSARLGRQNIMRGEGFILFDGTSGDGSRTQYFNAAVLSRQFGKSKLELMGILNPAHERIFPALNDVNKLLTEWNESAVGAYYTNEGLKRARLEGYYFYKKEYDDTRSRSNPQFRPDRHVNTTGGRASVKLTPSVTATGEFAGQWGFERPARDLSAWGGYGYVKKTFDARWKPYIQTGYWAMSNGWDPLFSRWPKWSDLVVYSLLKEQGIAYWTNMKLAQIEAGFKPFRALNGKLTYYRTSAFDPSPGSAATFGRGTRRGDNLQALLTASIGANWKAHALYEAMLPGDFYAQQPFAYFVRFEVAYSFRWHPALDRQ